MSNPLEQILKAKEILNKIRSYDLEKMDLSLEQILSLKDDAESILEKCEEMNSLLEEDEKDV